MNWPLCAALAVISVFCAAVGYDSVACNGLADGIVWTIALALLFIFIPPQAWAIGMVLFAGSLVTAKAVSGHVLLQRRHWLLFILLPAACLALGLGYALITHAQVVCSLGSWN